MTLEEMKVAADAMHKHRERMGHRFTRGEVLDYLRLMRDFVPPDTDVLEFAQHIFREIRSTDEWPEET